MKLATICALALSIFFGALGNATATETTTVIFDGAWWTSLSSDEKYTAVEGMLVGHTAGWHSAISHGLATLESEHHTPKQRDADVDWFIKETFANPVFGDRTFRVMVTKLDDVFVDHPKRAKYLVSSFVRCAVESGKSCESKARSFDANS